MSGCPFCGLADRSAVIYEDELCFVLVSQRLINPFHSMVVPRAHFERFTDLPDDLVGHLFRVAKRISAKVAELSGADFITHLSDDDLTGSGVNLVAHYKFHVIPRYMGDHVVIEWNRPEDPGNQCQRDSAERLRAVL